MPAQSQTYTTDEAIAIAYKLSKIKILNEKGTQTLIERIRHTGESAKPIPGHPYAMQNMGLIRDGKADPNTSGIPEFQEVSNATILIFLAEAFAGELRYRSGIEETMEATRKLSKKHSKSPINAESIARQQAESNEIIKKAWPGFKGPKIEAAILIEDSLPAKGGFTTYPTFGIADRGESGLIDASRSATGKTRSRTLRNLQEIGLVASTVAEELIPAIKDNTLVTEMDLLAKAASLTAFRADYERNKALELLFAEHLMEAGVMSSNSYSRLAASYKPYELKGKFGLLPFCERTIIFQTDDMPEAPQLFFEAMFASVQTHLLPGFKYSNFRATVYEDTSGPDHIKGDLIEHKLRLQFTADGSRFQHSAFYDFKGGRKLPGPKHPVGPDITKGINKWMGQQASPYRLYFANQPDSNGVYGKTRFALLLLTQAQYKAWQSSGSDYFIFDEVHDTAFTPKSIAKLIKLYDSLGLFAHLTNTEKAEGESKAEASEIGGYADLLACFPKNVVVFDWETGNLKNPYEEHIKELAAASRGAFQPTNIRDNFAKNLDKAKATQLSFDFNGKHYATNLKMEGDWLDPEFMKLLERALYENIVDGKWYYCMDNGQEGGYIFLTVQQYAILKEQQSALFPDN